MACASGFSYKYYVPDSLDYTRGMLRGPTPADDLKFEACTPSVSLKEPCTVIFTAELLRWKLDFEDTQNKLKACESALADAGRSGG